MKPTLTDVINTVNVFNQTAPALASLVLSMRNADGTETVLARLDRDIAQTEQNIRDAQALIDAHTKKD